MLFNPVPLSSDVTDSSFVRGFLNPSRGVQEGGTPQGDIPRNTWLRTSLRRSSPNTENLVPPRRWASFRWVVFKEKVMDVSFACFLNNIYRVKKLKMTLKVKLSFFCLGLEYSLSMAYLMVRKKKKIKILGYINFIRMHRKKSMIICFNIWIISLEFNWFFYDPSEIL